MTNRKKRSPMPGLERGLDVLRMFTRDRPQIGRPEMAQELGIPRSTVHRIVQTLEALGFLRRADASSSYALGPAVLTIGFEYLGSLDIVQISNPVLARLCAETGCSTHLVVRNNTDVVYLSRHASRSAMTSNTSVGTSLPAHATVTGRVLLAALGSSGLKALYGNKPLKAFTAHTPVSLAELEKLFAVDRKRGYAVGTSYYGRGITSVAAPLCDASGAVVAAINAVALDSVADARFVHEELTEKVCAAAAGISAMLGSSTPTLRALRGPSALPMTVRE
jgi:DNA-binding IclR family transcriptional regulator